jgi:hypothetical protein
MGIQTEKLWSSERKSMRFRQSECAVSDSLSVGPTQQEYRVPTARAWCLGQ